MGIFGSDIVYFKDQKYASLRKQAQTSGNLFQDAEFPPSAQSISKDLSASRNIEWKRPKEICSDPKLVVEGISSQDLIQGELGNCWLVAACCCLAIDKTVWGQVIPDVKDQEWDPKQPEKYAGIFHFRFWRYGVWTDVVIDDLLPCRFGKLVYLRSKSKNEFWSALLEKAYAKLIGSYEALDGGELSEALEDFTGGVSETFNLQEEKYSQDANKKEDFFEWLQRQLSDHALMAAAIPAVTQADMEKATESGLVMGHAYSVTAIKKVGMKGTGLFSFLNREKMAMIRLRNPWGGSEWKGAFSDGSEEWSKITSKERQNMGLTFDEDGEFWMTFDDFVSYFVNLAVCHMLNLSLFSLQKRYHASSFDDEWTTPSRVGGCINNRETFLQNPQYAFSMTDDENEVIIVLTQKDTKEKGTDRSVIGFTVLKVEENRRYRLHTINTVIASSAFRNSRSVLMRRKLARGRYVVVACKFDPGQVGSFLIRVYLGCSGKAIFLEQDKPAAGMCPCLPMGKIPEMVTRIKVIRGVNLSRTNNSDTQDINAYLIISCEGEKITSAPIKQTSNPEFNFSVIFYRRSPATKAINIDVWHSSLVMDDFIGRISLRHTQIIENQVQELALTSKKDKDTPLNSGSLIISTSNSRNLMDY